MKKIIFTVSLFLMFTIICSATDITGHWVGTMDNRFDIAFDFRVTGEILTGSTTGADGHTDHILNGIIKDDIITFTVDMMGDPTKVTGKIKDDVITLIFKMPDRDISVDLVKI